MDESEIRDLLFLDCVDDDTDNSEYVFFNHEIDHNPIPEDAGRIKVYASIVGMSESVDPIMNFSLPAKELLGNYHYRWEQLVCLWEEGRLNYYQVHCAILDLPPYVFDLILNSVNYTPGCALLVYINFKFSPPPIVLEEHMQVSSDEIRFRPASKSAVDSLPRQVYEKTTTSSSDVCPICFDEFETGQRVVTLPCAHEFGDSCILEWFAINHVCPLCRFEMPS